MSDDERKERARARASRIRRVAIGEDDVPATVEERIALCTELTRWAYGLTGDDVPRMDRANLVVRRITPRGDGRER